MHGEALFERLSHGTSKIWTQRQQLSYGVGCGVTIAGQPVNGRECNVIVEKGRQIERRLGGDVRLCTCRTCRTCRPHRTHRTCRTRRTRRTQRRF